jgi:zinc transporter 1/2/3
MLTNFQWFSLITILLATYAGGFYPLLRQQKAKQSDGFPLGQAFTSGVFLALSLTLMFPSALHLLNKAFSDLDYPVASIVAISAFLLLLGLEHITSHIHRKSKSTEHKQSPPIIPIIMTVMIAIPSFFLGTALGVSETSAAVFIWVAIMTHKSSAAFALALKMIRSTLSKNHTWLIFSMFAFSTPIGIVFGQDIHKYLSNDIMLIVKGTVLALAAGTFLYMSTLHDLENSPSIKICRTKKGFLVMVCGFAITALVRLLIGAAHHM